MEENLDGSFILLQENEVAELKREALNTIRFGNNSLDIQFKRDIELISLAIVDYGHSEQDKIKAEVLLKSLWLLFFGQVCYRHSSDQRFYPFNTLDDYFKSNSTLTHFPIASILLHGSRVLIEFPSEIAHQIIDWLIIDKNNWRYIATHGISTLTESEVVTNNFKNKTYLPIYKCLKEEKMNGAQAVLNLASDSINSLIIASKSAMRMHMQDKLSEDYEHYGINLALGGVKNQHFASKKIIQNNGEHGHLYINFFNGGIARKSHSGILLGIEQSAPGKPDQYGGEHDPLVSNKSYSASGGDFFCKKPSLSEIYQKEYQGLDPLPFANYYDSLWNFITEDTFALIQASLKKCQGLLNLLSREKSLPFIKQLLSLPGGSKQQDFDELFAHYSQEIPQVKISMSLQTSVIEDLQTRHEQLLALYSAKQQAEAKISEKLLNLDEQVQSLEYEKTHRQQEAVQWQQRLLELQTQKNTLLFNLAKSFMQAVIQQMGWRLNYSRKQSIMLSLQQLDANLIELSDENIRNFLKNFISISLINRNRLKRSLTRSTRACIQYLNRSEYEPLKKLLFSEANQINNNDLLTLIFGHEVEKRSNYISESYKKNLYCFYQFEASKRNQLDKNTLIMATQQLIYNA
jgi:hypothetical protein